MVAQGFLQAVLVVIVQFDEVDAFVLQELTARGGAHGSPGVVTALECFLNEETADETTGTSNQNAFHELVSSE